ncbi:8735_t:CDS:1, partial [Acaulospora morrowiae]
GKGKRKSMEVEEGVEASINFTQIEQYQQPRAEQEPVVGAEEIRNRRKNL